MSRILFEVFFTDLILVNDPKLHLAKRWLKNVFQHPHRTRFKSLISQGLGLWKSLFLENKFGSFMAETICRPSFWHVILSLSKGARVGLLVRAITLKLPQTSNSSAGPSTVLVLPLQAANSGNKSQLPAITASFFFCSSP